ncbi:unnamed protein product [Mesocestoides corti]|uniref:TNase-like domain-containing protein n=1 Tax=Mesocestoides corti TaxID=53468 RepID=A0A0R3UQN5_MESCO|nr:unnamed protein product [Mesocestoides corti]
MDFGGGLLDERLDENGYHIMKCFAANGRTFANDLDEAHKMGTWKGHFDEITTYQGKSKLLHRIANGNENQ